MDDGEAPDDLDVRLQWPEGQSANPELRPQGSTLPPAPARSEGGPARETPVAATGRKGSPPARTVAPRQELVVAARTEALQAALASIAMRVDALTSTTTTFRTLVSDRLTDYGEQVARAQSSVVRDLDEYRRTQDRALTDIDNALTESEAAIHRLDRATGTVATKLDETIGMLSARLDHLGNRMGQEFALSTQEVVAAVTTSGDQLGEGIEALEESTAVALNQVATRLERLAHVADDRANATVTLLDVVKDLDEKAGAASDQASRTQAAVESVGRQVESLADRPEPAPVALEPVLAAIAAVQDHLQTLADQPDPDPVNLQPILEAIADASGRVDDLSGRPEPEPVDLVPIQVVLRRIEALVEALADRSDPNPTDMTPVLDAINDLAGRPDEVAASLDGIRSQLSAVAETASSLIHSAPDKDTLEAKLDGITTSLKALSPKDEQLDRIEAAVASPPSTERVAATLERLERAVSTSTASRRNKEDATSAGVARLEETLERLTAAQAEDLERILDTMEDLAPTAAGDGPRRGSETLTRLEEAVTELLSRPAPAGGGPGDSEPVAQQLRALTDQVEALRRRIALRARPAAAIDDATIAAVADAVAARLAAPNPPGRTSSAGARRAIPPPPETEVPDEPPPRRRARRT
ncbi:MAG: hypothetical protein M3R71_04350 [Actinomycetota bacterium]|nr:hypothetical protein [Actinomycetota bacterium]